MIPGRCSTRRTPQSWFSSEKFGVRSWNHSCSWPKQLLRMRCPTCAGAGLSDTKALMPARFNLLKIMVWSCLVHLKEWPCFRGECVWCYELENHLSQTMPKQRRSSTAPVLTLLFHTSWPAWVALGFSRKYQEPTSEWLMPHLLSRKDSSFHIYLQKTVVLNLSYSGSISEENNTMVGERQQQRLFPKKMFTWKIFHLSLSVLKPSNQPPQLHRNLFWELHNDQVPAPYHNPYSWLQNLSFN